MMDAWGLLRAELDQWQDSGLSATLWWRDDDAAELTAPLQQLTALADYFSVPIHLAAIPARLEKQTIAHINNTAQSRVLQHGFAHIDHAPKGAGSWELGLHRGRQIVMAELADGISILQAAFADRFLPVLVPPWNRIDSALLEELPDIGLIGVSGEGDDLQNHDSYVKVINCHCDPIKWKENARFKGDEKTLGAIRAHLQDRRQGRAKIDTPTGLCTHHMDHKDDLWAFLEKLLQETRSHPAAKWLSIEQELALG